MGGLAGRGCDATAFARNSPVITNISTCNCARRVVRNRPLNAFFACRFTNCSRSNVSMCCGRSGTANRHGNGAAGSPTFRSHAVANYTRPGLGIK